jgi:methionyl-tRNA formyltransferase
MRTAFLGAVEGSRRALDALVLAGRAPDLVLTLPPEAAGRHSDYADLSPLARQGGSELAYTSNINDDETCRTLEALSPDLILVIGWSQICRGRFRSIPSLGVVGFHPAPLPLLRGRAPIPWTILIGLGETAASLFWIDEGCDDGDILMQSRFPVAPDETARSLYDKHIAELGRMLPEALSLVEAGVASRIPQDPSQASYGARRRPEDGLIDWTRPARDIETLVRAVGPPYPGAYTDLGGRSVVIETARVHQGAPRYVGLPGQVQEVGPDFLRISCGGFTCLEVTAWRCEGGGMPARHALLGQGRK